MIAPSAMMVEIATDRLKLDSVYLDTARRNMIAKQLKEVQAGAPNQPDEFYSGYQLGVETARVLVAGLPGAILNGVSI